jgi:hypothetical protein
MNVKSFFLMGGSNNYDSDAITFFTASGITDSVQKTAINVLVTDLKSPLYGNLWTNVFTGMPIHPIVGGNASAHSVNLRNPGTNNITWTGGVTHSSTGALGNGTTGFGDDGFVLSVGQTLNNSGFSFYSGTNNTTNGIDMGCNDGATNTRIGLYFGGVRPIADISGVNINTGAARSDGFFTISNTSNVVTKSYRSGSQINTTSSATIALTARSMYYLAQNTSGTAGTFSNREMRFGCKHTGLTAQQAADLYTIVQRFQTTLGRNV